MTDVKLRFKFLKSLRESDVETVKLLLEQGLDPDIRFQLSGEQQPAILLATETGSPDLVELLCQSGCNLSPPQTNEDPLHVACKNGDIEVARVLLKYRACVRTTNLSGKTPLHLASLSTSTNKGEIVSSLLAYSAEVDAVDLQGRTSLMYACHVTDSNIVNILLKARGDPLKTDFDGMTPLHFVCLSGMKSDESIAVLKLLLQSISSENIKSYLNMRERRNGNTPLHQIIQNINYLTNKQSMMDMIKLLIECGSDVNAQNGEGRTPLLMSINARQFEIVRILLSSGCTLSSKDLLGRNAIEEAARLNEVATLHLLLKADGPQRSNDLNNLIRTVENSTHRERLLESCKSPGTLQDLSRRSLVRVLGCRNSLKENLVPQYIKRFLQFQDCQEDVVSSI